MDWTGMTFRTRAEERREISRAARAERGKKGDAVLWCDTCGEFVKLPKGEDYDGTCPVCGMPIFKMKCMRCGKEWYPRDPKALPGTCPKCKSPYYNRTRTRAPGGRIVATPEQVERITERMDAPGDAVQEGSE